MPDRLELILAQLRKAVESEPPNGCDKVINIYVTHVGGQPKLKVEYEEEE